MSDLSEGHVHVPSEVGTFNSASRSEVSPRARLLSLCIPLAVVLACLCWWSCRYELIDDAYISFRYAKNWVAGHGLVYNPGERVEGFTNPMWVALLAAAHALGCDMERTARAAGALFAIVTVLATLFLLPNDARRPLAPRLIAPALLTANIALPVWAVHGLETSKFAAFITLGMRAELHSMTDNRPRMVAAIWFALATLTRPEGFLLFLVSWAAAVCLAWQAPHLARRAVQIALFLALFLPYELWRWVYYGHPLPNTFYAKVGMSWGLLVQGLDYVAEFFLGPGTLLFLFLFAALIAAADDRRLAYGMLVVVAWLGFVLMEGGDAFGGFRFIVPICPLLYWLIQEGVWFSWQATASRLLRGAILVALASGASLHIAHVASRVLDEARADTAFTRKMRWVGQSLADHLPPGARIAVNPAGALPYFSGLYAYDMLGLTNEHIAHRKVLDLGEGPVGHEKGDGRYIFAERPDIILFGNVQVVDQLPPRPSELRWNVFGRSERELAAIAELTAVY